MFKPVKLMAAVLGTAVFCATMVLSGGTAHASRTYIVDVDKVYAESEAGKAADKHLEEVRKVLQKGFDDLKAHLDQNKDLKPEERDRDLQNGLRVLERQLQIEVQAARNVVHELMLDCIRAWRKVQGGVVLAKSQVLDFYHKREVTDTIIKAMDKKEAKFGAMPVVTLKDGKKAAEQSAEKPAAQESKKAEENAKSAEQSGEKK